MEHCMELRGAAIRQAPACITQVRFHHFLLRFVHRFSAPLHCRRHRAQAPPVQVMYSTSNESGGL